MIKSHASTDAYLERKDTMKLKQFSVAVPVTLIVLVVEWFTPNRPSTMWGP